MREIIDISTFSRKGQYENFIGYTHPVFTVSTHLDVTALVGYCKEHGRSFFSEFLFIVSRSANEIEEFRTRIDRGEVVRWDRIHPSYIVMQPDENIVTCMTEYTPDRELFYEQSRRDIQTARTRSCDVFNSSTRTDCLYISCVPWVDLTAVTDPYNFDNKEQTSIPRISWSAFVEEGERIRMGFSLSAHHAFADGLHAARLIKKIQDYINAFDKENFR